MAGFRNYKKTSKKTKRSYRKKSTRNPRGVSSGVKKYVNRAIHKNVENKRASTGGNTILTAYNVSNNIMAILLFFISLYLSIPQGVGQGDRTGNSITLRKVLFKYVLTPSVYNASLNPTPTPQMVKFWFGYTRASPLIQTTSASGFFQSGDSSITPGGYLTDMLRSVNADLYKMYTSRTFKLGNANYGGSGGQAVQQYNSNNDYKLNHLGSIDVTKYMIKTVKFNDTTNNQSNGHGLFLYATTVRADGLTNSANPVTLDWWLDYEYEDA